MGEKISVKAICVGVLIGLIGSSLASVIVALLWGAPFQGDMLRKTFYSSTPGLISDLVLSLVFTFLSGYVTAKVGKGRPFADSIVVGLIQLAVVTAGVLSEAALLPGWYAAAALITIVPAVYLGSLVAAREG